MLGATGTIGRATVRALVARGHEVVCLRFGDALDPASLARDGRRGERFDVVVSCLASQTA